MLHRLIRACAVALGAVVVSTAIAVAGQDASPEPPVIDATASCPASIDPGFIATIEDFSNDRGFFTTIEDISNDSGFLSPEPLAPPLPGDKSAPCPSVVPLPEPTGMP